MSAKKGTPPTGRQRTITVRLLLLLLGWSCCPRVVQAEPLTLEAVLSSVERLYPPYLMVLLERDIASGRLRQTQGAFDLSLLIRGFITPAGYYDGRAGGVNLEQPFTFWGGSVFAGYQASSGPLAIYDKDRTQREGELRAGLRLNLLRDGPIDRTRAEVWKAELDRQIVDPFLQRQQLDIRRTATRAYYQWVAAGLRLRWNEALLQTAQERDGALAEQVSRGLVAPIAKVDNERLVVSRRLALVQAQRRLEAAAIELSLFYRDASDQPQIMPVSALPAALPVATNPGQKEPVEKIQQALERRPELRRIQLVRRKLEIDQRLARNALLPTVTASASLGQSPDERPYSDIERTELRVGLEARVPLQRREARGRLQTIQAEVGKLELDRRFTRERITAEVRDAYSALQAAHAQIEQTARNVELAQQLEAAEGTRFREGAGDLLSLQIREQATFDAHLGEIDARADYFRALADVQAAIASPLPEKSSLGRGSRK